MNIDKYNIKVAQTLTEIIKVNQTSVLGEEVVEKARAKLLNYLDCF